MAVRSKGKKQPTKMRKMAARSPTPNQRMAIGIQASGEIGRKICTSGLKAISARRYQPIVSPRGIAVTAARRKPQVTRKSEATTYFSSSPCCRRSPMPRTTPHGPGSSCPGWRLTAICQRTTQHRDERDWAEPDRQFQSPPVLCFSCSGARTRLPSQALPAPTVFVVPDGLPDIAGK